MSKLIWNETFALIPKEQLTSCLEVLGALALAESEKKEGTFNLETLEMHQKNLTAVERAMVVIQLRSGGINHEPWQPKVGG